MTPQDAPLHVGQLVPDELPPGKISRLMVEVGRDALARPLALPVLVARGTRPGPVLGITAAVHGNELNGIPVIQRLFKGLDPTTLRGTIVGVVVVNIPGYLSHSRGFLGSWDLNHSFPGRADGNAAEVYVHRLMDRIVTRFDLLLDLHTASFGRVNSLYVRADMTDASTARLAYLQRPQIVVHNPPSDQTLRGAAAELGIPAITVEIGNPSRYHKDFIKRSLAGVRAVLADQRMLRKRPTATPPAPTLCESSGWLYTQHGGLLEVFAKVGEHVTAGAPLARLTTPFGDTIADYAAPSDGVVVGHSTDPVAHTGARIVHLGKYADPDNHPFHRFDEGGA